MFKKLLKKDFKFFLMLAIFMITTVFLAYSINFSLNIEKMLNKETIHNNIYINFIDVSNLTKEEAMLKLTEHFYATQDFTLLYEDKKYRYSLQDFGLEYDFKSAIDSAYSTGRKGSKTERYREIKNLEKDFKNIIAKRFYSEEKIKAKLKDLEETLYIKPVNATIKKNDGKFVVSSETFGSKLDFDNAFADTLSLIKQKDGGEVSLKKQELEPTYKAENFAKFGDLLGSYKTSFKRTNANKGRIKNIEVAASKINGLVLYPGDTFSTYANFGETTAENGYKKAPTIVNGDLVDDYGGGICQVSSTLYNAVLFSELDITMRQNHSLKVSYLDYGYDATIAGDYIDFRFKNSSKHPVYIESYVTEDNIFCNIYGIETRGKDRKIKFENALVQVVEPDKPKISYTDSLYEGVVKTKVSALKGYKYKLYKLVYEGDILKEKVLINTSYYKPRPAQVFIGTRKK